MGKTEANVNKNFGEDEKCLPQTFLPAVATSTETNIQQNSFRRQIRNHGENRTLAIPSNFSGHLDELEERVKSMMEKSQNRIASGVKFAYRCKVCGKEGLGRDIKDHIEANHLKGVVIPCDFCEKTFRSRNTLRLHKRQHKNSPI